MLEIRHQSVSSFVPLYTYILSSVIRGRPSEEYESALVSLLERPEGRAAPNGLIMDSVGSQVQCLTQELVYEYIVS
jgi:hypothetical protein